ncbi:MAG: sensor histidine kinase [Jatrophihabitans sp.]
MDNAGRARAGLSYPRLVPATLLPPEDPSRSGSVRRTVRDWFVDVLLFLLAVGIGVAFYAGTIDAAVGPVSRTLEAIDIICGAAACLSLWWRRRWPTGVAVVTAVLSIASASAAPASVVGLFGVAVHRRTSLALAILVANLGVGAIFPLIRAQDMNFWVSMLINLGVVAVVVAWGMFVRARRQLIWTLRERADRAETEQRMLAEQARLAERTRIAREMHDVLAHRISLMALHAGGLQVRSDLPPEQVRQTAALLRSTAQRALEELRGVIGVLRDETVDETSPAPPQPRLQDIPRLVHDTRAAGAKISFTMDVPDDADPPASLGRDAYRIVQEALTNVAKHASGTATYVRVDGTPGDGLRVEVRNRMPVAVGTASLPGSGSGLLGLLERVTLAGGTLEHGPNSAGEFVVAATLAWV